MGCCCVQSVQAAHEADPVVGDDSSELNPRGAGPPIALKPWGKQQQDPEEEQLDMDIIGPDDDEDAAGTTPAAAAPARDTADTPGAFANASAPSPSPAPKMATILPMLPMVLPGCPYDDILDSNKAWDFPKNWASLTLEQQALHPINLVLMNMVGIPSTDMLSMVNPCLYSWGVVKGSVTKIVKDYKVGNSMTMKTVVLVFRTKKNVWVVFRWVCCCGAARCWWNSKQQQQQPTAAVQEAS